ncbi:MAG: glycosyltransferase family 4 protein [Roseiflexaceae bacterium]|jgi:starch synthase|nr:glycosyltransferase family 4 protein [Chloroflexaceae bacterium]
MKILYVASGIPVPGNLGGSTHAIEVARGLHERGHDVHVVAVSNEHHTDLRQLVHPAVHHIHGVTIHHIDIPKPLSLLATPTIVSLARRLQPDIIMERYYNFAGAGMLAARLLKCPTLLEVNALIVDPPSIRKRQIDDRLGGPMRRWATQQCRWADAIVTPLHTTIPAEIDRTRIHETPWGADVERFTPRTTPHAADHVPTVIFIGSFRAWHGVAHGVQAARLVLERGIKARFVFVGHGPEYAQVRALAANHPDIVFTGAQPYAEMPRILADADIGIAPFDTSAHPALRAAGFFWSPLKVHEYMAMALPVITSDITPLNQIVRHDHEGLLVAEGDVNALADAMAALIQDPAHAQRLGMAGRARVVSHFSWQQHCAELERIMRGMLAAHP